MTIIEIINNPIILQITIWVLLGLWLAERGDFDKDASRVWAVIFSPLLLVGIILAKIFNLR